MKTFLLTAFSLFAGLVNRASGNKPHVPLSVAPSGNGHTPWYVFAGIVFVAVVLSALTVAHAEPKK